MKNMRKVIAGIMSALLLITTGTMNGQIVSATDSAESTEISTEETTVYKGEAYNFGERQTNWYSRNELPDSSNVDAYSLVDGYEMTETSITSTATLVTDVELIKAVYYSYGAPGYVNSQTAMEEVFLAYNAITAEERAGISYLLISGYANDVYNLGCSRVLTDEEQNIISVMQTKINELSEPDTAFKVYVLDDVNTTYAYDLIYWKIETPIIEVYQTDVPQLYSSVTISANSYWSDMKAWIVDQGMLIAGANGYGIGGYSATSQWSCAGWVSKVIYGYLGETGISDSTINSAYVPDLQDKFLEVNSNFERVYNMVGNETADTGCTSYATVLEATNAIQSIYNNGSYSVAGENVENTFIQLVTDGSIKSGDIIIFYGSSGRTHAAIVGDDWTNINDKYVPNIYNALNSSVGSTSDTPVSYFFTDVSSSDKDGVGFAIYRYKTTGTISLVKESGQTNVTDSDESKDYYNLEGAVYSVTDANGTVVGLFVTDSYGNGIVASSATDSNGNTVYATMENTDNVNTSYLEVLPGNYTVTEIKAPIDGSYKIDASPQTVEVVSGSNTEVRETDYIETAKVYVKKVSANSDITDGNDCYSLKDAEYVIYKEDGITVADYIVSKDDNGQVTEWAKAEGLLTDEDGNLPVLEMPFGTYYVKEVKASKGYKLDTCSSGTTIDMHCVTLEEKNKVYEVICKEIPVDDPVNISLVKWDNETQRRSTLGGASMANAYFEIKYYNSYFFTINELPQQATKTWVIKTTYNAEIDAYTAFLDDEHKVYGDEYYYRNGQEMLPLGTVTIEEINAPVGYKLVTEGGAIRDANGVIESGVFLGQIRNNPDSDSGASLYVGDKIQGTVITGNPLTTEAISIFEPIIRTDLSFTKLDFETREVMAGIPFKITSKTTGESHIVVTDEDGYFSTNTSHMKHTDNTNGNDQFLSGNLTSYDDCVETGVWFYGTADQTQWDASKIDDAKSALPYDTYIIEELPCEKNQGRQLEIAIEFTVSEDKDSKVDNVGVLTNVPEPVISTMAFDAETGEHISVADDSVTIVDTVSYKWLEAGKNYTIKGILMDKSLSDSEATAKPLLDSEGKPIIATTTFTVDADYNASKFEKCGEIDLVYEFDGSNLAGESYVVFEYLFDGESDTPLYVDGELNLDDAAKDRDGNIIKHTDVNDVNQIGYFPDIETKAWAEESGENVCVAGDSVTICDEVSYTGLIPTYEYKLVATLMNKDTEEPMLDSSGNPMTVTKYFTPSEAEGSVNVVFNSVNSSDMKSNAIVVYEELYWNNRLYASHVDINDTKQTVYFPEIHTMAVDSETEDHIAMADENVTIIDTVSYENLPSGKTYTIKGVLMNKATGEPIVDVDGNMVTAETILSTHGSTDTSGTKDVIFTFDATKYSLEGIEIVVFEELYFGEVVVAEHKDITDEGQTIVFGKVETTAKDADTGMHTSAGGEVTIVDTATYSGLLVGKEYVIKGTLMDKDTGKPFLIDGKELVVEKTFTATKSDGQIELSFTFDAGELQGKSVVVFETVYYNGIEVAVHADIEDHDQSIYFPEIKTTATDKADNNKEVPMGSIVTVVDTVTYTDLAIGETYVIKGVLMDKSTGEPLVIDGKTVTASKEFMPDTSDGTVEVEFTFSTEGLKGKELVVFEELYLKDVDVEVANHKDINDEGQTVRVTDQPKTGDTTPIVALSIITIISLIGLVCLLLYKKNTV